jgi:hypothetical protein
MAKPMHIGNSISTTILVVAVRLVWMQNPGDVEELEGSCMRKSARMTLLAGSVFAGDTVTNAAIWRQHVAHNWVVE